MCSTKVRVNYRALINKRKIFYFFLYSGREICKNAIGTVFKIATDVKCNGILAKCCDGTTRNCI